MSELPQRIALGIGKPANAFAANSTTISCTGWPLTSSL